MVNHWPSKSGGESESAPSRKLAASVARRIIDSLQQKNPAIRIILMGDLNDNPTSEGVIDVLNAKEKTDGLAVTDIYNPWISMYKKGLGTESYHGEWNLIDQIMLTGAIVNSAGNNGWKYYKAEIFNRDFLINKVGKDKGLPHRSFTVASVWDNGYSDHFPVLVYLVKKQ
jgi:endonuclease/exonuclease/phosphatase family metal-dependent hydrolase